MDEDWPRRIDGTTSCQAATRQLLVAPVAPDTKGTGMAG